MVIMIWNFEIEVEIKKVNKEKQAVRYLELDRAEAEMQRMKDYYQYLNQSVTRF